MPQIFLVHPIIKQQTRTGMQVVCLLASTVFMTTFLAALYARKGAFALQDSNILIVNSDLFFRRDKQGQSADSTAYVLSMDSTSAQARHTELTLTSVGFRVIFITPKVTAHTVRDNVWSHKLAFLGVLQTFARQNDTDWLYLFEDDVAVHSGVTFQHIRDVQSQSSHFMYLGICGTFEQFVVQWWTFKKYAKCGRCSHAMGFSRKGAHEFLAFNHNKHNMHFYTPNFDIVVEAWCLSQGGFPVVQFDLTDPNDREHHGAFFQNRYLLPTSIV
jgi:hypothetical protein